MKGLGRGEGYMFVAIMGKMLRNNCMDSCCGESSWFFSLTESD